MLLREMSESRPQLEERDPPHEHTSLRLSSVCTAAQVFTVVFRATGDETSVDVALALYRAAVVSFTRPDSLQRLSNLNGLAYALRICFNRRRNAADLQEAVLLSREALALSACSSAEQKSLWNLGASLRMAYSNLSGYTVDHLYEAVSLLRRAVCSKSLAGCGRQNYLGAIDLGNALSSSFLCSRDPEALLEASDLIQMACGADDIEDADRIYGAACLVNVVHLQNFTGSATDPSLVDTCVHLGRRALSLRGDWQYRLLLMQVLATMLRERCFYSGSIPDSNESIVLLRRALQLDPGFLGRRPMFLRDLGLALRMRYDLTGSSRDLDEAMVHLRAYYNVAVTDLDRVSACLSVGLALMERFEVSHASTDIDECINLAREARRLAPAPSAHFYQAGARLALGLIQRHYHVTHSCTDLDEAISYCREYLADTNTRDWEVLINLGWALRLRYEDISRDRAVLVEARDCHLEAMSIIGRAQWNQLSYTLTHLLQDHLAIFAVYKDPKAHDDAMGIFRELMANRCLAVRHRLESAITVVQRYARVLPITSTLEIFRHALVLLPQVAYLGLERNNSAALLLAPKLAAASAKCALEFGRAAEAVEFIEVGRAIFWRKALQLRTPSDDLPDNLSREFSKLSRALENLSCHNSPPDLAGLPDAEERWARCHAMADRYQELLGQIRAMQCYEGFLLPNSFQKLQSAAQDGFIVVLTPTDPGYTAILLSSTWEMPRVVKIPDVTAQQLVILSSRFNRETECLGAPGTEQFGSATAEIVERLTVRKGPKPSIEGPLADLWQNTVYPIMQALDIPSRRGSQDRPRLFWCPTGQYISIPLHAAGIYTTPDGPCATDYVVQSYIPTIGALLHAQREQLAADSAPNILLVAQPGAPDCALLPHAVQEINTVVDIVGEARLLGVDDPRTATVRAVSLALPTASVVHFACHGRQARDALRSGFVMNDGVLTIDALMRLELPQARFAFLSACHAAAINPDNPPDEVLHLAAAMLHSGFRSVIATMWAMNDADGPAVAREVYTEVFRGGRLDLSRVPYALDAAVRKLKDHRIPASRWATYIHMGI